MTSQTNCSQRPALQALNKLNNRLQTDGKYISLEKRIAELQSERQNLYEYVQQLKEELQLEKKLRKSWQANNNSAKFIDHSEIRKKLNEIKAKNNIK